MYPPPPKEIVQKLIHSDLVTICFGSSVVNLHFENENCLSVEGPFRFAERRHLADAPVFDFPLSETRLIRVLGCSVNDMKCDTDGTLELGFSNGDVLIVYANDPAYEAYILLIGGKKYVV